MQTFGRVAYVDYTVDLNEAIVRYTSADAATRAADGLNNEEEKLGGQYVKAAVLTGLFQECFDHFYSYRRHGDSVLGGGDEETAEAQGGETS